MTHTQLLQPFKRRIKDVWNQADSIMSEAEANAETLEAQTRDGYTIAEDITRRLLLLREEFASIGTELCLEILEHNKEAREELE